MLSPSQAAQPLPSTPAAPSDGATTSVVVDGPQPITTAAAGGAGEGDDGALATTNTAVTAKGQEGGAQALQAPPGEGGAKGEEQLSEIAKAMRELEEAACPRKRTMTRFSFLGGKLRVLGGLFLWVGVGWGGG